MAVMIMFAFFVCMKAGLTHIHVASLVPITVVVVHIEQVMGIVLLCESTQQFRDLMIILQYHKTLSIMMLPMPYCVFLRHPRSYLLCFFRQSLSQNF